MSGSNKIGDRIKKLRLASNMTQKQFGVLLGVSDAHISKIESNKDAPSRSLTRIIADKFGVSTAWIVDGTGSMGSASNFGEIFSRNMKEAMAEQNVSMEELSSYTGISATDLTHMLNGFLSNDVIQIILIAGCLNVSVNWLLTDFDFTSVNASPTGLYLSEDQTRMLSIFNNASSEDKSLIMLFLEKFNV